MTNGYALKEHRRVINRIKRALEELGEASIELYSLGADTEMQVFLETAFHNGMPIVSRRELKHEEMDNQTKDIRDFQKVGSL